MEDFQWDIANKTKMGNYLTLKEREFIDRFIERNSIKTCLDVGCGSGRFSMPIAQHGINVVSVDYDLVPLKKFKANKGDVSIQICRGDANKILKMDGYLIFTVINKHSYKNYLYLVLSKSRIFYRYNFHEIILFLKKEGFKVEKCTGYNWIPFKRNSNSFLIAIFEFLERILMLQYFPTTSPGVFFITKKAEESDENTC